LKRKVLPAVHEHDLERLLSSLDLLEAVRSGKVKCAICGDRVDLNNFQCVYAEDEEIKVCCSKLPCYRQVLSTIAKEEV